MSQLNDVENTLRKELIESHMENGVYFQDPNSTYICVMSQSSQNSRDITH